MPTTKDTELKRLYGFCDPLLASIESELQADGKWGIQIGAAEAAILQFLARMIGARKILEIGALYGFSTICLARTLPPEGRLWSLEIDSQNARRTRSALAAAGFSSQTQVLEGDALKTLGELASQGPFDLVFIDANKLAYLDYLDWAERNVRPGGIIVADNTLNQPEGSRQLATMQELNRRVIQSGKFNAVVIPTQEGLTVAQKL